MVTRVEPATGERRQLSRRKHAVGMIGTRSAHAIRASGLMRRNSKAGHMTAPDQNTTTPTETLASEGPSTHD